MFINIVSVTNREIIDDLKMNTKYQGMFLVYFDKTTEQIDNQFYNCDVKNKNVTIMRQNICMRKCIMVILCE